MKNQTLWLYQNDGSMCCSNCLTAIPPNRTITPYCPCCGAMMGNYSLQEAQYILRPDIEHYYPSKLQIEGVPFYG